MQQTAVKEGPHAIEGIDPQMADAMLKSRELLPEGKGNVLQDPLDEVRRRYFKERVWWNEDGPKMAHTFDRRVDGPDGPIPVRFYYPSTGEALPLTIFFHGGGFIYGSIESHDKICRWLAARSGVAFCSVDYGLAPEHKFPTQFEQARAVLEFVLAEGGAMGFDTSRIAFAGDSAGATISLGTALDLKSHAPELFGHLKALLLFYGNYGLGYDNESTRKYGTAQFGLDTDRRKFYRSSLVRNDADHDDPRLAHLSANLSGLPPVILSAAEIDPLCDNTPALAEKLKAAGVEHSVKIWPGVLHGFLHLSRMVDASRNALDDGADKLKAALG